MRAEIATTKPTRIRRGAELPANPRDAATHTMLSVMEVDTIIEWAEKFVKTNTVFKDRGTKSEVKRAMKLIDKLRHVRFGVQ